MRILDRYIARQILPVWCWCLAIFVFLSSLIDLFGHLDEIIRYRIPAATILEYYLNFAPMVMVKASPFALLIASAFLTTRLMRHQEFLTMRASGTSMLRSAFPYLFIGWIASIIVFVVSDRVIPHTAAVYEQLRLEVFRGGGDEETLENVAILDSANRLYHARELDLKKQELTDLTVLEHDQDNRPTKNLHAARAIWTPHGWLLLYGTIYRMGEGSKMEGSPEPFVERLIAYPVTPASFSEPEAKPEIMPFAQLRTLIHRLRRLGISNVRYYTVELASKLSLPFMNVLACLIGFVVSIQTQVRSHMRGLGMSLWWGCVYYVIVAACLGIGKQGGLPVVVAVTLPHLIAMLWCWRRLSLAR